VGLHDQPPLLLVNEAWSARKENLRFTRAGGALLLWDPLSGRRTLLRESVAVGDAVSVDLEAAQTPVLTLERRKPAARSRP
jgi:hypothetical protein